MIGTIVRSALLAGLCWTIAGPASAIDVLQLDGVVAGLNRTLPRMVAKDLRQERTEVMGMTVVNQYTHLTLDSAQLRRMHLEVTQRPFILPQLCAASDTSRMLREGVQFRYIYRGRDGEVGGDIAFSRSDCGR